MEIKPLPPKPDQIAVLVRGIEKRKEQIRQLEYENLIAEDELVQILAERREFGMLKVNWARLNRQYRW
jgi:hypothetical protein